jgi:hypothetical protein
MYGRNSRKERTRESGSQFYVWTLGSVKQLSQEWKEQTQINVTKALRIYLRYDPPPLSLKLAT